MEWKFPDIVLSTALSPTRLKEPPTTLAVASEPRVLFLPPSVLAKAAVPALLADPDTAFCEELSDTEWSAPETWLARVFAPRT